MNYFKNTLYVGLALFVFACESEKNETDPLSSTDAKASMAEMADDLNVDLVEMTNSEGADALVSLVDIMSEDDYYYEGNVNASIASPSLAKIKIKKLENAFIPAVARVKTDGDEIYDDGISWGIYTYNFDTDELELVSSDVDYLEINFPIEGSTTNNSSLRIDTYEEEKFEDEEWGDVYYSPTAIVGNLKVDGEKIVALDLSASYTEDGNLIQTAISLTVDVFQYDLKLSDKESKASSGSVTVSKGDESIVGASVNLVFEDSDKEELLSGSGQVSYRTTVLKGDIVDFDDEMSETDINDYFNLTLYQGESKIGDIVWVGSEDEGDFYIVYADDSKELLEDLLAPVLDEVEDFIMEIEGEF